MSTYTPGPWRVSGCQLGQKLLIEHGDERERSPCIGSVYTDGGKLPQEANARLIAAAPELLEALQELVAEWKCTELGGFPIEETGGMILAKLAIAKAEGRG